MGNKKSCMEQFDVPHPGEVLRDALGELTVTEVAKRLHVSRVTLSKILNCRSSITAEMSLRLAAAFGGSKTFWIEMQTDYDVRKAMEKKLPKIEPFHRAA